MVSDQEIAEGLEGLFRETNPNSFTSLNDVILRLQSKLGFDLSHKIDFIRAQITLLFSPPPPNPRNPTNPTNPTHVPNINVPHPQQHHLPNPNNSANPNNPTNPTNPSNPSGGHVPNINIPHPQQHHLPNPSNPTNPSNPSNPNAGHGHVPNINIPHPQQHHQPNPTNPSNPSGGHVPNINIPHPQQQHHFPNPSNPNVGQAHLRPHQQQQPHQQQHLFHSQSHFPRGPTQISFAQPGGIGGVGAAVGSESLSSPPAKESTQRPKRRGGPGGLNKLCGVSPQLQAIVGQPAMPRTEIVKQLWAYIRKNNLQDPSNKRKIICNEELRLVFEVDCTDMFQMNKLLAKHILPLDSTKDLGQQSKKLKVEESKAPSTEPAPIVISEALAKFLGTSEKAMLQSDVYKSIEEYIKAEGLEDPSNSMVMCDTKLQELLGCESIAAPEIRETLVRSHLFQQA